MESGAERRAPLAETEDIKMKHIDKEREKEREKAKKRKRAVRWPCLHLTLYFP